VLRDSIIATVNSYELRYILEIVHKHLYAWLGSSLGSVAYSGRNSRMAKGGPGLWIVSILQLVLHLALDLRLP